ncbi:ribosomal protein bL12 [Candidatus Nasuia deltocephalinicola]|uniref:ribosomal protein bL12 n=1 Tax=Candidatus Nasuia deltocephalincola TaxID=1160784 RepID=UPI00216B1B19|nr:bL12 family ribosomal protein [Candidatus Nasuia deltocephalinicola]
MKNIENILNLIENMTLIDLNQLIVFLKKKYNIENFENINESSNFSEKKENKKTEYFLNLLSFGNNKISIIKTIKDMNNLGLKESKELVESCPVLIKKSLDYNYLESYKEKLENLGAKVDIKKNE